MIDLHPVLQDPSRLRQRLIMAEVLARRGHGPLALGSYVSAHKPPMPSAAPLRSAPRKSTQGTADG